MSNAAKKPASKFAAASQESAAEEDAVKRPYIQASEYWDEQEGQEFGGASGILELQVGEVAGPFTYTGHQNMTTELGDTTVHTGNDEEGNQWRLPIQATFLRAIDQARISMGDKFAVKRLDDVKKKRGKGAGNMMAIFAIKVLERAAPNPSGN